MLIPPDWNEHDDHKAYLHLEIVTDEAFHEYEGFDLRNSKEKDDRQDSRLLKFRVPISEDFGLFRQVVADHLGSAGAAEFRFRRLARRVNGTYRADDVLEPNLFAWSMLDGRPKRSFRAYMEKTTDSTGKDLPGVHDPDSILIFLKYFDVAKQRLYGVGKVYLSRNSKMYDLVLIINKLMNWEQTKKLQLCEEIQPGMIEAIQLAKTVFQNDLIGGDIICFQEALTSTEKRAFCTHFPGFIVEAVEFYHAMQRPASQKAGQIAHTPARAFDFHVLPRESFSDALKRTQARMGLLDKDISKYRFMCTVEGDEANSAINTFNSQMNCGICLDVFVDPVSFLDCMHLACGSCATEWLSSSNACPQCRQPVRKICDNHHMAAIVEAYQKLAPDPTICGDRTEQELALMRTKYKPGQTVRIAEPSESDSEESEEEYGFDDDDDAGSVNTDLAIALVEMAQARQTAASACLCCIPGNPFNYDCPDPVQDNDLYLIPPGHTNCAACNHCLPIMPFRGFDCCAVCTRTTCVELGLAWSCNPGAISFPIIPLQNVNFSQGPDGTLLRYFTIEYERKAVVAYARDQKLGARDLCVKVLQHHGGQALPRASWHGFGREPFDLRVVKVTDKVCYGCANDLLAANVYSWWNSLRPTLTRYPQILSRSDCEFGISCSRAHTDAWHARSNNHICLPAHGKHPNDRRNQTGACEDGNRMVSEPQDLQTRGSFPFDPSEVQFRDKDGEPVFLCSVIVGPHGRVSTIPGRMTLYADRIKVRYASAGFERAHNGTVRVLIDMKNMRWVRTSKGMIPPGCRPVFGGVHESSGDLLYHCAVWWKGRRIPGLVQISKNFACITWDGLVWMIGSEYELLCWE